MDNLELEHLFRIAEVELVYRRNPPSKGKIYVKDSKSAYQVLKNTWDENKIDLIEQFKIILLNRDLSCIGISEISSGGITGCIVDPKVVFTTALKARATSIILAHNHPSSNLQPSDADRRVTAKLLDGGMFLDIGVGDHLILSSDGYYSMADNGFIP
ncbi:MAG TPA: JAB domain-containing protein [Mucilaginibacter sp.]|nr:JAB domain-containing protein [Mucilaginibacter sp.]